MYTRAGVVESNASALSHILHFWYRLLLFLLIFRVLRSAIFRDFRAIFRDYVDSAGISRRVSSMYNVNRGAATTDEWRTLIIYLDRPARDNFP